MPGPKTRNGYYAASKQVTTGEFARQQKVLRTTLEEHVLKAESKVFHALAPFMMAYTS